MRDRFRRIVAPLAQRECRALFGAQLVSGLGDWAGRLALAVIVFDRSGSALWTAAVTLVSLLPWLGPGQLLSTLADRFGRVLVMVIADLVRAALFVTMALPLPTGALLALAFGAGLCVPPFVAARGAALVDVVEPERYGRALALFGVTSQTEIVLGYALGGAVIAIVGAPVAIVLNAATFLVSALLVSTIRSSAASDRHRDATVGLAGVREGARVWRSDPICRRALTLFVSVNAMMVLPEALVVPYADEIGAPAGAVGLLAATIALGALVAMALAPDHENAATLLHIAARRAALFSLVTAALFAVSIRWLPGIGVLALLFSGAVDAIAVPTNQVAGKRLPRAGRAAAMSVAGGIQYGSQAVGIALAGGFAVAFGSGRVLAIGALIATAVTGWSLARPPVVSNAWPPPASHPATR